MAAAASAGDSGDDGDKGIYEAVSKVLEGYDWTLVPMLNRWVLVWGVVGAVGCSDPAGCRGCSGAPVGVQWFTGYCAVQ